MLRCWDSDDQEELLHLKWNSIIANGMLVLEKCADETTIRKVVKDSLTAKFPLLGVNDFEFYKLALFTKEGADTRKIWVCRFTCLAVTAVH